MAENKNPNQTKNQRVDKETSMGKTSTQKISQSNDQNIEASQKPITLESLIYDTNTYQEQYNTLEDEILRDQNEMLAKLEEINSDLGAKTDELVSLSKRNKKLFESLKGIKEEVDFKMKSIKIINVKEKEMEESVSLIQNQIKARGIQVESYKKSLKNEEKQNKRLKKLFEENKDGNRLEALEKELEAADKENNQLKDKELELKVLGKEHKDCQIKLKQLQKKLEMLKNEEEFYQKRQEQQALNLNNSINVINPSSEKKEPKNTKKAQAQTQPDVKNTQGKKTQEKNKSPERVKTAEKNKTKEKSEDKDASAKNKYQVEKSEEFKKMEKMRKFQNSLSPLWNELNHVNRSVQIKKDKVYQKTYIPRNRSRNNSLSSIEETENNNQLFLPEEKKVLEKLIPTEQIATMEKKYSEIDNERNKIKEQLKTETFKMSKQIKNSKLKYDQLNKKMREVKIQKTQLRNVVSKQNSEISSLSSKINTIKKTLSFFSGQYKQKLQEYEYLESHMNSLNEMIKSGKLIKKENVEDNRKFNDYSREETKNQGNKLKYSKVKA